MTVLELSDNFKAALVDAVARRERDLFELAAELVQLPTMLGNEEIGQRVVEERLREAGFSTERIQPVAADALADETAGYPTLPYDGRSSVVGRLGGAGEGRSLHLSGHIDVVPIDPAEEWGRDPWAGEIGEGRLWGRGAGDMKGGLAAYLIAAQALAEVCENPRGDLIFSSVIEEETGGNGMWSVLRAGYESDATLIGEPTGLLYAHAATGVVWIRLVARGGSGHSKSGGRTGPFDEISQAVQALRSLEEENNRTNNDQVFAKASDWPYSLTVGRIEGGVWTSSAPAEVTASLRMGFGRDHDPAKMQELIRLQVREASPSVEVTFEAFRAHAWWNPSTGPLPTLLAAAHQAAVGTETKPMAFTATVDARFVAGPCLCYGPRAGSYHGKDEWVDLESLVHTAATVALTAAAWIA